VFGGLLQIKDVSKQMLENPEYIAVVAFFLFGVGLLFLLMHTRQRINSLRLNTRITAIEEYLFKRVTPTLVDRYRDYGISKFGADFFVGVLYVFINTAWFTTGMYLLRLKCTEPLPWYWNAATHFAAAFLVQLLLRELMLWKHETAANSEKQ
jgi:hypothetical protein